MFDKYPWRKLLLRVPVMASVQPNSRIQCIFKMMHAESIFRSDHIVIFSVHPQLTIVHVLDIDVIFLFHEEQLYAFPSGNYRQNLLLR